MTDDINGGGIRTILFEILPLINRSGMAFYIQDIMLSDIPAGTDTPDALSDWNGFVQLRPAVPPSRTRLISALENRDGAHWQRMMHWKPVPALLNPIGCHLLQGVELCGPGYLLYDSCLINDRSVTAKVSLEWIREHKSANPLLNDEPNWRVVEQPVMIVCGPGHRIWGHWIVEFLPRIEVARQTLGEQFETLLIALPTDTPRWVSRLFEFTFGIREDRILRYDPFRDRLLCRRVVIPSFCHTDEWVFHPFIRELFDRFKPAVRGTPRHIFVSRKGEGLTSNRVLETRDFLEELATARGYEVMRPEGLGFAEQFALFHDADTIVGEAGSGMHNAFVSEPGTIVASVTMANAIQLRIGELCGHHNVFMNRIRQWKDAAGVSCSAVREDDLRDMFDVIDGLR